MEKIRLRHHFFAALFALTAFAAHAYDPLAVSAATPQRLELTVKKGDRAIPVRVYLPAARTPAPIVLFSHGLGGSREGNVFMGEHWAKRGYVAVFMQHLGSDSSVWRDAPKGETMHAMNSAASYRSYRVRVLDVHATLDHLQAWNADAASPLKGRLDLKRIGMSGHSFGALTTQAVAGQWRPVLKMRDKRIIAAVMFSPSVPARGDVEKAFASVDIPWLLMTGTNDNALIGTSDAESRLLVYPALPPGGKYELVLEGAEHSAFTDRALPGDKEPRNPNHHKAILALSTAFWDAYLRKDAAARAWLDGDGAKKVLQEKDRWQHK